MRFKISSLLVLMCTVVSTGCEPIYPVDIELNFPSLSTFLYAEFVRIQVFDLDEDDVGQCPIIIGRAMGGMAAADAYLDSGSRPVCDYRSGGVRFEDIDSGVKSYVALVWNASNDLLLSGCTVGEAYQTAPPIRISLHMSDQYGSIVDRINDGDGPLYVDEWDKCEGGQ